MGTGPRSHGECREEGDCTTLDLTRVYLTLHCHSQNDCTKMGSDESRFNISSTVRGKVPRQSKNLITIFEEKGEPKRNQGFKVLLSCLPLGLKASPLGQTGSQRAGNFRLILMSLTSTETITIGTGTPGRKQRAGLA